MEERFSDQIGPIMDERQAAQAALELEGKPPEQMLAWAIERFGRGLGICSSLQAEGCALIDMAWRIDPAVRVFTIDSGRLPEETHDLIGRIRDHYGIRIDVLPARSVHRRRHGRTAWQ